MASVGKLLGKPLAWAASLGTAVLAACFMWLAGHLYHNDPALDAILVVIAAKLSGWIVATYGPKPTNAPAAPSMETGRRKSP